MRTGTAPPLSSLEIADWRGDWLCVCCAPAPPCAAKGAASRRERGLAVLAPFPSSPALHTRTHTRHSEPQFIGRTQHQQDRERYVLPNRKRKLFCLAPAPPHAPPAAALHCTRAAEVRPAIAAPASEWRWRAPAAARGSASKARTTRWALNAACATGACRSLARRARQALHRRAEPPCHCLWGAAVGAGRRPRQQRGAGTRRAATNAHTLTPSPRREAGGAASAAAEAPLYTAHLPAPTAPASPQRAASSPGAPPYAPYPTSGCSQPRARAC
jgi:hypothetical protein